MTGANVTNGLILDLTGLDSRRCLVDPALRRAALSPAVALGALNHAAAPHGLRLPVDPSSAAWATLGGMVSTNAAGPRSVHAGSIRGWVRGISLDTADGPLELARGRHPDANHPVIRRWHDDVEPLLQAHESAIRARFPRVRKNSAGYGLDHYLEQRELVDIVVGSEGTLGVITDITLDLEPVPRHRISLRVAVRDRSDLVTQIEAVRLHEPATLEFLDRSFLRLIAGQQLTPERPGLLSAAAGLLLADFEGDDPATVFARASAAASAVQGRALDVRIATDGVEIDRLWAVRHAASPILAGLADGRRSLQVIEDGCVPVARLAEYLDVIDEACQAERIDAVIFGHAGDGHLHVNLLPNLDDTGWKDRVRAVFSAVGTAVIRLGGTPSGEHGTGRLRAGLMRQLYGAEVVACFTAVKRAFDPAGCFNPGVIIDDGADALSRLKVGRSAAVLPTGVDEYLAAIEKNAAWAKSRW
jgi:FAD/FMN-containing dehydrogenase